MMKKTVILYHGDELVIQIDSFNYMFICICIYVLYIYIIYSKHINVVSK